MFVKAREMYSVKRYLHKNGGLVMHFTDNGTHNELMLANTIIRKALKTLISKGYVEKKGAWRHAWYFVTDEGYGLLKNEVGLPDEVRKAEENIIL